MFVVHAENEEFEMIKEVEVEKKELNVPELIEEDDLCIELSLNSMVGLTNPGTMKVRGKIQSRDMVVLIDCGATHNFISEKLVKELMIPMTDTSHYELILVSGSTLKGKGIYEALEVLLGESTAKENFLPIESGCCTRNVVVILLRSNRSRLEKSIHDFYALEQEGER